MELSDLNLIFVDVEATNATPITGVMTEFGAVHYQTRKAFHGVLYESMPSVENPAKPVLRGDRQIDRKPVMVAFASWLASFEGRPIFVSDNNGYDAMWIACAFDEHELPNPFGHSSRRISDFYSGLIGDFRRSQQWKRWRVTPHTHHPVDDAMGNVEAFATMVEKERQGGFIRSSDEGWTNALKHHHCPSCDMHACEED